MRGHWRTVGWLLAVFVVLGGIAWARAGTERRSLPPGSSESFQPDGARGLLLWLEATGAQPQPLDELQSAVRTPPRVLFLVQPLLPVLPTERPALESVLARGGVLILAGDTLAVENTAGALGIRVSRAENELFDAAPFVPPAAPLEEPALPPQTVPAVPTRVIDSTTAAGVVTVNTRRYVAPGPDIKPLLVHSGGEWVAVEKAHRGGTVIVLTSSLPLTNEGLTDADTAGWVAREIVSRTLATQADGAPVVFFDESHRSVPGFSDGDDESSMTQLMLRWVLTHPVGGAAVYGGALWFVYLLLSGTRLGPPLAPVKAEVASRTMGEHVQALAGLYRRGAQFLTVRAHFSRQYRRLIARALGGTSLDQRVGNLGGVASGPGSAGSAGVGGTAGMVGVGGRTAPMVVSAADLTARGIPSGRAEQIAGALAAVDGARGDRQLTEAVRRADAVLRELRPGTLTRQSSI